MKDATTFDEPIPQTPLAEAVTPVGAKPPTEKPLPDLPHTADGLTVGKEYVVYENGHRLFAGRLTKIRSVVNRARLLRFENKRGDYYTQFEDVCTVFTPETAPAEHIPTMAERLKELDEYFTMRKGR